MWRDLIRGLRLCSSRLFVSLISLVAKGVCYDKLGGNLPPIWMSTVTSKISKRSDCQDKLFMNVYFTDQNADRPDFLQFSWNHILCYELAHKIKTTCQINMKFGQNVSRKWNYKL